MKTVYILLALVVAASALGCIGKTPSESKGTPAPAGTPLPPEGIYDETGIEGDLAQMDSLFNESGMEISLSEVSADAFT